jgi:hypothetical protein
MGDLNTVAKRIHNVSPKPIRLTLTDGTSGVYRMHSTQFFQREFQAEGERVDDVAGHSPEAGQTSSGDDAVYRLVTSEDNASVLLGRRDSEDDQWTMVGEVTEAEPAESTA